MKTNKRIIISNNDKEEQEIIVESFLNKAAQVPDRRIYILTTDKDYFDRIIMILKDNMDKDIVNSFKMIRKDYAILEMFNLSTITIMYKANIGSFEVRGKQIDDLCIKVSNVTAKLLDNDYYIMNTLYSTMLRSIEPTITLAINNKVNICNSLIADYRKILI